MKKCLQTFLLCPCSREEIIDESANGFSIRETFLLFNPGRCRIESLNGLRN
jgi:hypothetical protein